MEHFGIYKIAVRIEWAAAVVTRFLTAGLHPSVRLLRYRVSSLSSRLGMKLRGKISVDNAAAAKAQEVLAQAERGQLTDKELKQQLAVL